MNDTSSGPQLASPNPLSEPLTQRESNKDVLVAAASNLPWNPAVDRSPSPTRRITDYEGDLDHFRTTKHRRNLSQSSIGANALDLLRSGFPGKDSISSRKKLPKIAKDTVAELTQQCAARNLIRQNPDRSCIDFAWRIFLFVDKHPDFPLPLIENAISMIRDTPDGLFPKSDYIKGLWHMQGRYCYPPNPDKGLQFLNSAAQKGIPRAFFHIGNYLQTINADTQEIVKAYKRGAELGDNACAYRLAICYFKGQFGLPFDVSKTLHYLEISSYRVDYEFALGAYIYGLLLAGEIADLNGSYGIQKDEQKARRLIEHAALVECAPALLRMGAAWQSETLGCSFDPSLSMHYYRVAAEVRSPDAFMELSKWFLVGFPGLFDQNLGKAVKLARIAASQGNVEAIFAIGYFYDAGIYLDPSPAKAQEWYHRAARAGNKEAAKRLESLTLCGPPALTKLVLPENRSPSPAQSPGILIRPSPTQRSPSGPRLRRQQSGNQDEKVFNNGGRHKRTESRVRPNLEKLDIPSNEQINKQLAQGVNNLDLQSPLRSSDTPRGRTLPDLPIPNLGGNAPPSDLTPENRSPTSSLKTRGYFDQRKSPSPCVTPSGRGYGALTSGGRSSASQSPLSTPRRTASVPAEENRIGARPLLYPDVSPFPSPPILGSDQRQTSPVRRSRAILRHGRTESVPIVAGGSYGKPRNEFSVEPPVPESPRGDKNECSSGNEDGGCGAATSDRPAKSAYSLAIPNLSAASRGAEVSNSGNNDVDVQQPQQQQATSSPRVSTTAPSTVTTSSSTAKRVDADSTLKEKAKNRRSWSPVKRGLRMNLGHSRTISQTTGESSSCMSSDAEQSTGPNSINTSSAATSETSASGSEDGRLDVPKPTTVEQQKYISRTRVIEALDDSARLGPKTFEEMGIPRGVDQKDCIIM